MKLIPWPRRNESSSYRADLEDWMSQFFQEGGAARLPGLLAREMVPPMNVAETDKEFSVSLELPGMQEKDIQVQILGDQLVISGQRKWEGEKKGENYHRVEWQYGTFRRVVELPSGLRTNPEAVAASYNSGVLTVRVPKLEPTPAKTIPVLTT
jgi:HSP20 family protein